MFCTSSALPSPPTVLILPSTDPPYNLLKTHPSLALLSQCKSRQSLTQIHAQFFKFGLHNTHFALSKLIEFCAISPHGDISYAISVFESIGEPNLITWNTLIRGLSLSSSPYLGLIYYVAMIENSIIPNNYSFPFVFKCCAKGGAAHEGKQIHGHVVKFGLSTDAFVHTSIINMYAQVGQLGMAQLVFDKSSDRGAVSCTALISGYVSGGLLDEARRVFDGMDARDVVTWNAMIAGYGQSHRFEDALDLFREMIRDNVKFNESTLVSVLSACAQSDCVKLGDWIRSWIEDHGLSDSLRLGNALIDMYAKCGNLDMARRLFDGLKKRDVISWNVMIGGYTHSSRYKEALALFRQMQGSDEEPNDVTFISILPACAYLGALDLGKWIHAYIEKNVMSVENTSLWTSLIDMYAKCGNIKVARQVFDGMKVRSLSAWNAMISGFAMHGHPNAAFELFSEMIDEGFLPDDITFVAVLSACSHAGLVDSGQKYFASMIRDYNITPKFHHYGCMIDLLGSAGLFEEAENLMKSMEMSPDTAIWSSLLGACKIHGKVDLGEFVAGQLLELEPENHGAYVLLSNIYAGAGRWDDVARVRTRLNDTGMKKLPGCSSIEVDSVVHEFLVGDKVHPQSKDIYKMLEEIDRLLERAGFVPDTSEVLFNMDEEWKEGALCHHSEKLAIAFGLISTKPGSTIRIVKNLRVCGNCHSATKLISKIFKREIIARDRNRFHHFKDGSCSCMDYW